MADDSTLGEAARGFFDASPDPMWVFDVETYRFLAVNAAAIGLYGYSRDEFLGMTILDIRPPEEVPRVVPRVHQRYSGIANSAEVWRHLTRAGDTLYVEVSTQRLQYAGRPAKLAKYRDVTAIVEFEAERDRLLRECEDRRREAEAAATHFRGLFDAIPGKYLVLDPRGYVIRAVSNDYLAATRRRREDLLGRPVFEAFPDNPQPEGERLLRASLDYVSATGTADAMGLMRYPVRRAPALGDGLEERFWTQVNTPVRGPKGELSYIVHWVEDVTDLVEGKGAEAGDDVAAVLAGRTAQMDLDFRLRSRELRDANLKLSEQATTLRTAKRLLSIGFWRMNLETMALWWSDEVCDMYGVPRGTAPADFDAYVALVHPDDRPAMRANADAFVNEGGTEFRFEHRILLADGRQRHVRGIAEQMDTDADAQLTGVVEDITDIRAAEAERARTEHLLRMAGSIAQFGGWRVDLETGHVEWTEETARIHDSPDTRRLDAQEALSFYPDEGQRDRISTIFGQCATEGTPFQETAELVSAQGRRKWVRVVGEAVRDSGGRIVAVQGAFQDMTELQKARSRSERMAGRLVETLEQMNDAFYTLDRHWCFAFINSEAERLLKRKREDLIGRNVWDEFPEARETDLFTAYHRAVETGETATLETYYPPLGRWLDVRAHPVERGLAVYFRDVTESRARAEQLRLLDAAVAQQTDALEITEADIEPPDGPRIVYLNKAFERVSGYTVEETIGRTPRFQQGPLTQRSELDRIRAAMKAGEAVQAELINYRKDGTPYWKEIEIMPLRDGGGPITHWIAVSRDISGRKEAEQALRTSEERFRLVARATSDVIWDMDLSTRRVWWSDGARTVFGFRPEDMRNDMDFWAENIHPEDRERVLSAIQPLLAGTATAWTGEYRLLCGDERVALVAHSGFVVRDDDGRAVRIVGSLVDISERRALEDRVRQSQRLDAVGQLTGGIAHDFNNLLTIIIGNAELLIERTAADPKLQDMATATLGAADRGAELTRRLLAFARRQALAPRAVVLNDLLAGMDGMLRRVLSEDVEIEISGADGLWTVEVDAAEFENALLNLAINARDAMPGGGRLTIETANTDLDEDYAAAHQEVEAGQYALVSVSDTGGGIAPDVLPHVFEPFFTTKKAGKGNGLGLSMVYGFVKQSGGHVKIYAERGIGTTVKLYFPRVFTGTDLAQEVPVREAVRGGTEHVLVVEDDAAVLAHAVMSLRRLGYRVTSAPDAAGALEVLRARDDIDLLFTDVVMPGGMNGRELSEAARALYPELPVLFTSGYTRNAIVHHGRLDPGVHLLSKPYRREELARNVRAVLDRRDTGGAG